MCLPPGNNDRRNMSLLLLLSHSNRPFQNRDTNKHLKYAGNDEHRESLILRKHISLQQQRHKQPTSNLGQGDNG